MNRKQKRDFKKNIIKKGILTREEMKKYFSVNSDERNYSTEQSIKDGDKVRLNVDAIKGRPRFNIMSDGYKQFVDNNTDSVLTAKLYGHNMIELEEDPRWLFWSGDLIVVNEDDLS